MYFDGPLKLKGVGLEVFFILPSREHLKYMLLIHLRATNNEVKYGTLLHGLCLATSHGIKWLLYYGDSSVVINQNNKDYIALKEPWMSIAPSCASLRSTLMG
jgi:ribonuclease HI